MSVKLRLNECLPIIRKAFEAGELQAQKHDPKNQYERCLYSGPCAIGVCLEPKARRRFDKRAESSFYSLVQARVVDTLASERPYFEALQQEHDNVVAYGTGIDLFEAALRRAEVFMATQG